MNPKSIIFIFLIGVCSCNNNSNCLIDSEKFLNAYPYPDLQNKSDTDIYSYPIKDSLSQNDSFIHVTYGTSYFKKFNERNFSLKYFGTETFRFSFSTLNITFDKNEMIIKTGKKGSLDPILNEDKLDSTEIKELWFFEKYYFANKESMRPQRKKMYDSVIKMHPQLLSIERYKKLYDKALDFDSAKFEYETKVIKLSTKQYCNLIDSLNASDFWKLPWRVYHYYEVNDGEGYTFEANTKDKYKIFISYAMPVDSLKLTGFCKQLIEFAGLKDKYNYF